MSFTGSQNALNRRSSSRPDLSGAGAGMFTYARSEVVHPFVQSGYNTYSFTKTSGGGGGGGGGGMTVGNSLGTVNQRALMLQSRCQEFLQKAEFALQSGGPAGDAERYMMMAKESIEQLKGLAVDLRQMGQPNDNIVRTMEMCREQLKGVHMVMSGSLQRQRSSRGSSGGWEEPGRSFSDAVAWINQQKRLIETAPWGDDPAAIDKLLISHQKFHQSIQSSQEMEQAREDAMKKGDKGSLRSLEMEWDSLQQMSFGRTQQLGELKRILEEISQEIMWVNDREEEELVFDWGDKNLDQYIPRKQESYSKLMSALEDKERDLNKLKARVDLLLKNNHPASDKIEAYRDTLQTQWSWLLQITKCIDVHLKENGAYNQFFKEANETFSALQKEHETVRKKFTCDKNTPLENLQEILRALEKEKEKILQHKRNVQHLASKSKTIVRLKPRNPEEKSSGNVFVKALCDFKQDQKVICKDNEAILKDNSQRSKWHVTGPGGLDMLVPSICLIVPPPNPLSIALATKNDQYYESILSIWNQLFINVKSLIAWQYCLQDINRINSLTITMLSRMRPEEYRQLLKSLETRYEEFKVTSKGSQLFADEDRRTIETQVNGAQAHYDKLVVELPTYIARQEQAVDQQRLAAEEDARRLEEEERRKAEQKKAEKKKEVKKEVKVIRRVVVTSSSSLSDLHALRLRLEEAEAGLAKHVHICFGEDGVQDCGVRLAQLEAVQLDVDVIRQEYLTLRERITKELEEMTDLDKAQFLRSELGVVNQRLSSLESSSSAYLLRLRALRDMLESLARAEDIVKVQEAKLTEKETTSLTPSEVEDYVVTLKGIKAEMEQKKDILASMEAELAKASHWNSQVGGSSYRCDMMLSKYSDQVGLIADRWRRILAQIDTRLQDLHVYLPQLQHYRETGGELGDWIQATRAKQDALQATKITTVDAVMEHINQQKALNSEIKAKRETVESVLKDNETCVNSVKDYETDLSSYASGLETLLNIPIKRTMLKSPTMDLNQEATELQTRYIELLTLSGDYHKFLGELLKAMEELKIRGTNIDLLEEKLRSLTEDIQDRDSKNKSLEDAIERYKLQLAEMQGQLLSVEEVKTTTALQCSTIKDSLDSTQNQMAELNDEVTRLQYLLEEEKRKRRLAEERYTQQQEEYESVLRKRQSELEAVSWSKVEVEKSVSGKDYEIEQLRRQLAEEAARVSELQREVSKVRTQCGAEISSLKLSYESQIQVGRQSVQKLSAQREEDAEQLRLRRDASDAERRGLEEELRRLKNTVGQADEQRRRAEEEAEAQRLVVMEEGRRRRELEAQLEALLRQKEEERSRHRQELTLLESHLEEKTEQLVYSKHSLEEEARRRKTTEEGQAVLEQSLARLKEKLSSTSAAAGQLKTCEEELNGVRVELEREKRERDRLEQNLSRLQVRVKDLQAVRDRLESQAEEARGNIQAEVSRRKQAESELEKTAATLREYNGTVAALRQSQERTGASQRRMEEERLGLQKELEKSLNQMKISEEEAARLRSELKSLRQQLLQERTGTKEANQRNEGLRRTLEEKTKALNESTTELQRLMEVSEAQAKERLRLEEELRAARHDKELLVRRRQERDSELSSQTAALELRLQASERSNLDYRDLISELSSEREKLRLEAENVQKEATEMSATLQSIQSDYSEIVTERDALLLKLQLHEKDRDRVERLEEELSRIKLSLESELRSRQRVQEENERMGKDLIYWKEQYESKQGLIKEYDSEKERLEREKSSLRSEIERLMRELRELEETYKSRLLSLQKELQELTIIRQTLDEELRRAREPPTLDPSTLVFDGVRKPVTADKLLDCGVLDKVTFDQLVKGNKTVPEVSVDKKVPLKGTGPIAGVIVESRKGPGFLSGSQYAMTLTEAKKGNLLPPDSADLLLDAQAATGHIIDPRTNQKMTVEEAYNQGVIDEDDLGRLQAAEAAAVGYNGPGTNKPLSVFQAMKSGMIDRNTTLRLLQAQESVGGILDPVLSVFLPKDTAIERNLIDNDIYRALSQRPELYLEPESEGGVTYASLKRRCKVDPHTGLLLLPVTEKVDPSQLVFDGVRKPVTAKQLLDCGVLEKPTYKSLENGSKTVPEVSVDKAVNLKGTGPIAGVLAGSQGKMSLSEAKKQDLIPAHSADLLLEAQAATGHIIDPRNNQKLTVEEACALDVVDIRDRDRLLAAEAAAVGYKDLSKPQPLSVYEAMKNGLIDSKTGLRLLQAQECVGGILDPHISVFLPKDTAIKRNLLDESLRSALNKNPECYLDPDTEHGVSYAALKRRCKTEVHSGLLLLPIIERKDPSKVIFDGVRKPVSAQQLLDCGVLDKPTFDQLLKGEKTVPEVSVDKKVFLKGTGSIAGVAAGPLGKMSFAEAKQQNIMSPDCADMLLDAQAATGYIIEPRTNQKLTVKEALAGGVVDWRDESKLLAAEAAAVGYRDPNTTKLLSAGQAMKKGLIDRDTTLQILQAQESAGGILDPVLSVFLPKDIAKDRDLIDEDLYRALSGSPECYMDPDTLQPTPYITLKRKCTTDPITGLLLLPEPKKPATVQGLRSKVSVIDLVDANLLERSDIDQLSQGRLTSQDIEYRLRSYLQGSTCIAGVYDEASESVKPFYQAMKDGLLRPGTTLELLEAQAASGFIVDPVNNLYLTVNDAYNKRLFGPEFKDNLLAAESAVTGYKLPGTDKIISLFQAIQKGLVLKGHGIRLLEAQVASGGIIDPEHSHRIDIDMAYKRGYLDEEMNTILSAQDAETKGFFDPNTEENLTYMELKKRCTTDKKTGLILLPIEKQDESTQKNTVRKRRVLIVDPETNKEMSVREAYDKGYIDYETFVELSQQEGEWEEITITASDGSTQFLIIDKKTGREYDINQLMEKGVISKSDLDQYRAQVITLSQFADIITEKQEQGSRPSRPSTAAGTSSTASSTSRTSETSRVTSVVSSSLSSSSSSLARPLSPSLGNVTTTKTTIVTERDGVVSNGTQDSTDSHKKTSCVSVTLSSLAESVGEQSPIGAIFDTETLEKISITEALNCGLVDSITAQRLLEAQACTGGIVNPSNGRRLGIQEACRQGIINDDMAAKLKPAQKAFMGFEDVKTRKKLSAAEAIKEMWLPYEAGQRFMEFQFLTGGLYDPELGCRRSLEDALKIGWIDGRTAQKLQDIRHYTKNLTCPKSKLNISYKEAMDNCLVEENTGVRMLQASSVSSRGISSPYNVSNPGSAASSRSGSRRGSRRGSMDLGSPSSALIYSHTTLTTRSVK